MGVDVRRGLVVRVANNLHCYQWVDTRFVQEGNVIVPQEVWRQRWLDLLREV